MDAAITPTQLRDLRKRLGLTAQQAADSVRVKYRTWKGYEAPYGAPSHRDISESTLSHFCIRHELVYPPISDDGRLLYKNCKVVSFTTYKGGVGKSPITVAAAALLANEGYRVAVVTNDVVFRSHNRSERPPSVRRFREQIGVDFYDEANVRLYPYEVRVIEEELRSDGVIFDAKGLSPAGNDPMYDSAIRRLESKRNTQCLWQDIINQYDYIFVDLNRRPEETFLLSTLIVVLVDALCVSSINSAEKIRDRFVELNGGAIPEKVFGLMTNYTPAAPSDSAYAVLDSENFADQERVVKISALVKADELETYQHYSRNAQFVKNTQIPLLSTYLTNSHRVEIARFNSERTFMEGWCYFNSVVNVAPDSPPADEIKRLVREVRVLLKDLAD